MSSLSSPFQYYPTQSIAIADGQPLKLKALASLPLSDLAGLSDGSNDETGHACWRGALVFLALLGNTSISRSNVLTNVLRNLFINRTVIELGAGSGIGGLGLLRTLEPATVESLAITDGDASAVDLSRENFLLNFQTPDAHAPSRATFSRLQWSVDPPADSPSARPLVDTVFACDVVYDVSILPPLFATAARLLKPSGVFALSHICRSTFNGRPVGSEEELEAHIQEVAASFSFSATDPILRQTTNDDYERGSVLLFRKI